MRSLVGLWATAAVLAFSLGNAGAQQSADLDKVKAASQAFYQALAVIDDGEAMGKVWAHTGYVTYYGPGAQAIIVGWDAQKQYWVATNKEIPGRSVSFQTAELHVTGNLAWEMGEEIGSGKLKDGSTLEIDFIATNVYEKINGRWLMVSHHVQPRSQ
jgi:ketosteroid isomerase-like protein